MDNLKLANEILNRAVDSLTKLDLERFGIIDNEYLIFIDESQKEGNRVLVAIIVPKSYWQYLRTIWDTGVRAINGNPAEYDLKHEKFRRIDLLPSPWPPIR